jgi:hypothetical protein
MTLGEYDKGIEKADHAIKMARRDLRFATKRREKLDKERLQVIKDELIKLFSDGPKKVCDLPEYLGELKDKRKRSTHIHSAHEYRDLTAEALRELENENLIESEDYAGALPWPAMTFRLIPTRDNIHEITGYDS